MLGVAAVVGAIAGGSRATTTRARQPDAPRLAFGDAHRDRLRYAPAAFGTSCRARSSGDPEARIDRIVHAGDWTEPLAVELFEAIADLDGIAGDNDGPKLQARFGTQLVLKVDGARLGVAHGHLGTGATTRERAIQLFADEPGLAAIVFGHSHAPLVERPDDGDTGTWLVNPARPPTSGCSRGSPGRC